MGRRFGRKKTLKVKKMMNAISCNKNGNGNNVWCETNGCKMSFDVCIVHQVRNPEGCSKCINGGKR